MFKLFYPVNALDQLPFCLEPKNIKAVLSDPRNTQNSILVLEPEIAYDVEDGEFYTRIAVKGTVISTLIYLNSNENP